MEDAVEQLPTDKASQIASGSRNTGDIIAASQNQLQVAEAARQEKNKLRCDSSASR